MNLFLIHPDPVQSAQLLAEADPIRARKQLLEACQLLANFGSMPKADGSLYGKAHPNHPITRHMALSRAQCLLALRVGQSLASVYPGHACSRSLAQFCVCPSFATAGQTDYIVCRKGQPVVYVDTLTEYAALMADYCRTVKGMAIPVLAGAQ